MVVGIVFCGQILADLTCSWQQKIMVVWGQCLEQDWALRKGGFQAIKIEVEA